MITQRVDGVNQTGTNAGDRRLAVPIARTAGSCHGPALEGVGYGRSRVIMTRGRSCDRSEAATPRSLPDYPRSRGRGSRRGAVAAHGAWRGMSIERATT